MNPPAPFFNSKIDINKYATEVLMSSQSSKP